MAISITSGLEHPPLLVLLADGEVHSGEWLAAQLHQTRAAVWKGVERLRAIGIEVQALARRGYRLARPVELLDAARIRAELAGDRRAHLHSLELLFEVGSTNTRLLSSTPPPPSTADVCMAELQHAGRGRLGRRWVAPFGGGIAMSLGWTCSDVVRTLPALSLGVGVAVSRALVRAGNTRTDSAHNRYNIAPVELIRIQRQAREKGLDIVGFYHSHPDHPAQWSTTDFAEAHWLGCSYAITSVEQGKAKVTNSFLLTGTEEDNKEFNDESIEINMAPTEAQLQESKA